MNGMKKIKDIGMKKKGKFHYGDPFRGMLQSGCTSKGTNALRERAVRSDSFGTEPEEWEVCLQMVEHRNNGWTYGKIAHWLNDEGITTKVGNQWNYFTARFVTLRTVQILRSS